jgi:2-polyprenyl-3-methyl-5-hydroxy-6-metoxy-1,4-benzoquinol methylase
LQDAAEVFVCRRQVPAHQHQLCDSIEAARGVVRGDLRLACCTVCGFVFNESFDGSRLQYGERYDNSQGHSAAFNEYTQGLVRHLVQERGVVNARIVEVGCGQGSFLRALVAADPGNSGYGFDPSYQGSESDDEGRVSFQNRFYDRDCAEIEADVVVCRHVIEHVPDPLVLLGSVRAALGRSARARVFFETPCLEWILRNRVVWDLFYEHCSYFTAGSLAESFGRAGFHVDRVTHVFSGQYLWLEASIGDADVRPDPRRGVPVLELARSYGEHEARVWDAWKARIGRLLEHGPVAVWGAGAKGVTFANLVDPTGEILNCVVDLNPRKQGRFLPGTGHPIVGFRDLDARQIRHAVLMNPNYREENLQLIRGAGLDVSLVDG